MFDLNSVSHLLLVGTLITLFLLSVATTSFFIRRNTVEKKYLLVTYKTRENNRTNVAAAPNLSVFIRATYNYPIILNTIRVSALELQGLHALSEEDEGFTSITVYE